MSYTINMHDFRKRIQGLKNKPSLDYLLENYNSLKKLNSNNIKVYIEKCIKSNSSVPIYVYMNLFDSLVENGTVSDINKIGNLIINEQLPKARDAKNTLSLLKGRLTRLQNKTKPKNKANPNIPSSSNNNVKTETAIKMYEKMIDKMNTYDYCDNVLENYNTISKRFNIDYLFEENTRINGVQDTVFELCKMIDTYSIPDSVKFSTIIETAWYGFENNNIPYLKSVLLNTCIDYFLFKDNGYNVCKEGLENSLLYDKDMKDVEIITEEEPEKDSNIDINESIINYCNSNSLLENDANDEEDFNKIFQDFKKTQLSEKDNNTTSGKLKNLISKLYSKNVNNIVNGTPGLLTWIRSFFILGTGAVPVIGPILLAISFIADKFISMHYDRKQVNKMIECFEKEIQSANAKLKTVSDDTTKNNLSKYIDSLKKAKNKIEEYRNKIFTDEEIMNSDNDFGDTDISDLDDDNLFNDFDFNEVANTLSIIHSNLVSIIETDVNETSIYDSAFNTPTDTLCDLATVISKYPDELYKETFINGLKSNLNKIRNKEIVFSNSLEMVLKKSNIYNAINILENTIDNKIKSINDLVDYTFIINDAYKAINIINASSNENKCNLTEASFTNILKTAQIKLKNLFNKMTNKEKEISKTIDTNLNNTKNGIEKALTSDNREAVIKGSILPSASKIIKLGIVNAGLIMIGQPVLAIITTLGYFGTTAKFRAKERQMVIDEIEIELKMCQKYIDIAESKNDMKALKQLLTIQKNLERQRQRIKYKMKIDFGQKTYDTDAMPDVK